MTNETFPMTQRRELEAKLFYGNTKEAALADVETADYRALFIPEIADARVYAGNDSPLWKNWLHGASIRATGKTKARNAVVVYAHIPNSFSTSAGITEAKKLGLRNCAGILPDGEFQRLLDLEDRRNVFVVDYETLKKSSSDVIKVSEALKHPQTIPFLGGEEQAVDYLGKHEKVLGNKIGNWHVDDLQSDGKAVARLLCVCYDYDDGYIGGLDGSDGLESDAQFVGVRDVLAGEVSARKISPTQEQLERIISEYVAPVNQAELSQRISALYK